MMHRVSLLDIYSSLLGITVEPDTNLLELPCQPGPVLEAIQAEVGDDEFDLIGMPAAHVLAHLAIHLPGLRHIIDPTTDQPYNKKPLRDFTAGETREQIHARGVRIFGKQEGDLLVITCQYETMRWLPSVDFQVPNRFLAHQGPVVVRGNFHQRWNAQAIIFLMAVVTRVIYPHNRSVEVQLDQ